MHKRSLPLFDVGVVPDSVLDTKALVDIRHHTYLAVVSVSHGVIAEDVLAPVGS